MTLAAGGRGGMPVPVGLNGGEGGSGDGLGLFGHGEGYGDGPITCRLQQHASVKAANPALWYALEAMQLGLSNNAVTGCSDVCFTAASLDPTDSSTVRRLAARPQVDRTWLLLPVGGRVAYVTTSSYCPRLPYDEYAAPPPHGSIEA